ncbi:hypothetical protein [Streptomyces sp. 8L]|uniref:hypothetical protein n=1 Tax=Streptomyces sp. 8L TaxID=2877242 RepID=UPI001CD75F71|nr:hypothetical protein [Streptomyces sp. 8L]MCA1218855.1 hypothetical protein [Streptomyces sp. 8L]
MTRIPDAVAVASLDTHRLIVTVPNSGPADIACNLPRPVAADVLRQLADGLDSPAGRCATARATGRPCPVHDAPTPLDSLLAAVAEQLPADDADQAAATLADMSTPAERAVDDARQCLAFNDDQQSPALASLRDLLLASEEHTPTAALATAYVLLAAHTRELSSLARRDADDYRDEYGVSRGTRGLLTGMHHTRRLLDEHAVTLDGRAQQ